MKKQKISPYLSVSDQITPTEISLLKAEGYKTIINNRPDGEEDGQPTSKDIQALAAEMGLDYVHLPVIPGKITSDAIQAFAKAMAEKQGPVLAYCRTGTRAITLWALSEAGHLSTEAIIQTASEANYDLSSLKDKLNSLSMHGQNQQPSQTQTQALDNDTNVPQLSSAPSHIYDVVIVGGGAGGLAAAASLHKRDKALDIAVIEPKEEHYYQPGWTLVGGGVFSRNQTKRSMASVMPSYVKWIKSAVAAFAPSDNKVITEGGEAVAYKALVVAPGLKLNWAAIDGLEETLGKNGVTSNYRFDLASYTWELVKGLKSGKALFTQPPMPIKCAGAPQKAMYLSCDEWFRKGRLDQIDVAFHNAGGVLFGVSDYVPALEKYIEKYNIDLHFNENLIAVDGDKKIATFALTDKDGNVTKEDRPFDMLHVCPPQCPLDFMKDSPITNEAGWVDVNNETLQHVKYGNIFGIGDGMSAPNAKTAAAVRKQAPVVAHNVLSLLKGYQSAAIYEGYGSCPLTVERGKIVLAEFGYGGALQPTFPPALVDGTKPTKLAWFLKEKLLPWMYFSLMLKGHEWLAAPQVLSHSPVLHEAQEACDFKDQ